jgi:hypothetical protein
MPSTQPFSISCKGGLNTNLNEFEILTNPGLATKLRNYEVDPDGGYRRINGYTSYAEIPNNPSDIKPIRGLQVYADGVLVAADNKVYFSYKDSSDNVQFIDLAYTTAGHDISGVDYITGNAQHQEALTFSDQADQVRFIAFEDNVEHGRIAVCDGNNVPLLITITGSGDFDATGSREVNIKEINVDGSDGNPTVGTFHKTRLVFGGIAAAPNTVYYSTAGGGVTDLTHSPYTGSITLDEKVVGLTSFRDDVIVFCKNSIFKIVNLGGGDDEAVLPITKNVGCLDAGSIQEIGGDVLFLAPDGIRTIAGTARIGDVELSSVSRQVQALIAVLASEIDQYNVSSCVIRSRSQYRLFYSRSGASTLDSNGLIGTLTADGFEWSETRGIQALALTSDLDTNGIEQKYHGDNFGYIYYHDRGNFFHEKGVTSNINAIYETPNYDFGDLGTPKTLEYVRLSLTPEASATVKMNVTYNSNDINTPQPQTYDFPTTSRGGIFGIAVFNVGLFGTAENAIMKQFVQGTGYTASFRILTENQDSPYTINGLYVNYAPSTRR